MLPCVWKASLLAVDGVVTSDVERQLTKLPGDATHLVLSVGGNDSLRSADDLLRKPVAVTSDAFLLVARVVGVFELMYRRVVETCLKIGLQSVVCTIYNGNFADPEFQTIARVAVAVFNDAIIRLARENGLSATDLRLVCTSPEDYANPIEPSAIGGEKIARAIWQTISSESGTINWDTSLGGEKVVADNRLRRVGPISAN